MFKSTLEKILAEGYEGVERFDDDEFQETFFRSPDLSKIKDHLAPFAVFDNKANRDIGLIYIENILKHTAFILKETKINPTNESEVYNGVKHVIKSTFPEYYASTEPFMKEAKHYKPDILIPSLNTAIEYKYALDEQKLIKTIEDILIDVIGYSNHHIYKIFYAVFYVSPGICTPERFTVIWNGYRFPENWNPIFVIGN